MTWFQPEINGIVVPARYLHSASVYDDKLFVYGGFARNSDCKREKKKARSIIKTITIIMYIIQ